MKKTIWSLCYLVILLVSSTSVYATLIQLENGSFEIPDIVNDEAGYYLINSANLPSWETTAPQFEIWSNEFLGVKAYDGDQHVELNSSQAGTLYQDLIGITAGKNIGYEFAHRGRTGLDTMLLTITDMGLDGLFDTDDDFVLINQEFSTGKDDWVLYKAANIGLSTGNNLRFAYTAVNTFSGDLTMGNFLDAVKFGVDVGRVVDVPEPSTLLIFGLGIVGLAFRRNKKI